MPPTLGRKDTAYRPRRAYSFDQAIHVAVKIGIGAYVDAVTVGEGL